MTDEEQKRFQQLILARLDELAQADAMGQDGQATVELDQQAVGRLSRMDALQNQAMAKAGQTRRNVQLQRLKAALSRLAEGEFGYCDDCGEPIAKGRLELDPAALLCVSCARG